VTAPGEEATTSLLFAPLQAECRAFRRVGKRACPGFRVQTKVMDQTLLDHIIEDLNGGRIREALAAYTAEREQARQTVASERSTRETELAELGRKIGRWLEAFGLGGYLAELGTERLAQLRADQAETSKRLAELTFHRQPPPFLYKAGADPSAKGPPAVGLRYPRP
jgi:hypothetical protein